MLAIVNLLLKQRHSIQQTAFCATSLEFCHRVSSAENRFRPGTPPAGRPALVLRFIGFLSILLPVSMTAGRVGRPASRFERALFSGLNAAGRRVVRAESGQFEFGVNYRP